MTTRSTRTHFARALTAAALILAAGAVPLRADDLAAPLPTDPRLVTGRLDNGLKYIVLEHANPPGRAAMWIHVSSGSLNETDAQRGIAHYLEHMAFNGSENFGPGEVVKFFEAMGLTFGQHQNAFTSFDQTTYQIAMPDNKPETIQKAMTFFGDVAGRMSLLPAEIDEERKVIIEEKRARSGANQRVQEYVLERLAPGSTIGKRLPIGVEETLLAVMEPDFREYYSRWYTPSNMTVMVVADADEAAVVEQIKSSFGFGQKAPVPEDRPIGVVPYAEDRAIVATDPELTTASVAIARIDAARPPVTTRAHYRQELVDDLGASAFNRRMGAKLARGDTAYLSASAAAFDLFNAARMAQASADGKPDQWRTLLTELGTDLQRARLHGFSQRELDDVKAEALSGAEELVQREKTLPARVVLTRMNGSVAAAEPIMSAQQELDLLKALLPTVTADEVSAAFAAAFEPRNVAFIAELPSTLSDIPTESELISLGRAAVDVAPEKEAETARATALMAKAPTPGKVAEQSEHAPTAVLNGWLDNGVNFHYRFMDYRKDQATITVSLAGGQILETAANRGVSEAAGLAWGRPATKTLGSTDIRDLMTGKKVRVGGGAGMDTMSLSVSGSPEDLETGLQLAHLLLTEPKIEASALQQWKEATLQQIEARDKDPRVAVAIARAETLYPKGDARTQPITAAQVNAVTLEAAQAWLERAIATAPIEVSVVGDIGKERALELVGAYLGSLPKRDRIAPSTLDDARSLAKAPGAVVTDKNLQTKTDMAVVASGFYGADISNVADARAMELAARVIDTRMFTQIREKEQLVYSPGVSHQPGAVFPGFGVFMGGGPTDPAKVDRLVAAIDEIYADFAKTGPTAEELDTARKQTANNLDETMKEPNFWTARLATLTYRDQKLDDIVAAPEAYQSITADQIKAAFTKYFTPASVRKVIVRPGAAATEPDDAKPTDPATTPASAN